jgi:hypothetical protein
MGDWYQDAADYWSDVPPTVEGMLGGFGFLSDLDSTSSLTFIDEYINGKKDANGTVVVPPRIQTNLACGMYWLVYHSVKITVAVLACIHVISKFFYRTNVLIRLWSWDRACVKIFLAEGIQTS